MILVFIICGYQIPQLLNNWMESKIITLLNVNNEFIKSTNFVPFPGITICSDLQLQYLEKRIIDNQISDKYY